MERQDRKIVKGEEGARERKYEKKAESDVGCVVIL